jgi:DNA-binding NarL/FixJ family response regulator
MRILIAESSLLIADRLTRTLNELPRMRTITHATTVAGVIRALKEKRPHVAIVDPHIADSEGLELLKDIKRHRPAMVLIVLSNFFYRSHRRKCLAAGADYFLDKSNEFDRVPQLIRKIHQGVRGSSVEVAVRTTPDLRRFAEKA